MTMNNNRLLKIEMLSTGDEVLQGDIADTNAAWLGQKLGDLGLKFQSRHTVADDLDDLVSSMRECAKRSDWVFVNGGLGPTSDDCSAQAAARLLGVELELYQPWLEQLQQWYARKNLVMPQSNAKQAMLPKGAEFVDNPVGTACGFIIEYEGAKLIFTPGVPSEMKKMALEQWFPRLPVSFDTGVKRFYSFGLSESWLNDKIDKLTLPLGARIGYRSARPSIEIKIFYDGRCGVDTRLSFEAQVRELIGSFLFCEDQGNWAQSLQDEMLVRKLKLSLAESCTGGMIADQLVAQAGSSAYFVGGIVAYSNSVKSQILKVSDKDLAQYGAVSLSVVEQMAQGVRQVLGSDIGIATSGVAGPDGGSESKPVGTVCFAISTANASFSQTLKFSSPGRHPIRVMATAVAMDMLRRYLNGLSLSADYQLASRIEQQGSEFL
ncbi:CinA family nicotinamide mononucleotide deamidase-related protein [Alginatibacterium sediminis]|uniref:CinA-like protein n=1 Tax=Alginatibacterium sediminis TaxID=2164068 RepID=A0A420E8L9_9ALTE|nr:CinA family nicotinamide mononucleotide deamidase-related protein [Alginatibacterium sediminis]RKF15775.1 CinA family nicotinamide mononucleotide deamidase-related protein [Alginatibacterium sediminis]